MPGTGGEIGRALMIVGALVFVVGLSLAGGWRLPLGRLPDARGRGRQVRRAL